MAWLKIEHDTLDKPEVMHIANILGIDLDSAFGKCVRVWRWFDLHTKDGYAPGATFAQLDQHIGVTGVCAAMHAAGWLLSTDDGIEIPKFHKHISQSAKTRASSAVRMARRRAAQQDANESYAGGVTSAQHERNQDLHSKEESKQEITCLL